MSAPTRAPAPTVAWVLAVARAVVVRPGLWAAALAQVRRLAPRGWWHRRPFLPLPSGPYLAFRSQTMYGDATRLPDPHDVVTYLRWCRDFPHGHEPAGRPAAPTGARG